MLKLWGSNKSYWKFLTALETNNLRGDFEIWRYLYLWSEIIGK